MPGLPTINRRSMRHPSGRWARCRRSAPILRDPRSSAGVAAPREARRRTSIATREPRGSRASRSTSSRPSRRLRERITQPLEPGSALQDPQPHDRRLNAAQGWLSLRHALIGFVPVRFAAELAARQEADARGDRGIGAAMVRRHAERIKRCKVCGGWIAHI